jgi:hypothetical protein
MPSSGGIIPPSIIALRPPEIGKPLNLIDTETYLELFTGKWTFIILPFQSWPLFIVTANTHEGLLALLLLTAPTPGWLYIIIEPPAAEVNSA